MAASRAGRSSGSAAPASRARQADSWEKVECSQSSYQRLCCQKAARVERLKDLLAREKKDDGLVFDELGVDHVFIDEAHYFKNLETPTKMERVAGIQTGGSERGGSFLSRERICGPPHPVSPQRAIRAAIRLFMIKAFDFESINPPPATVYGVSRETLAGSLHLTGF